MRGATVRGAAGWILVLALGGCGQGAASTLQAPAQSASTGPMAPAAALPELTSQKACEAQLAAIDAFTLLEEKAPGLSGRHQVLGRAKGWPVYFVRRPKADSAKLSIFWSQLREGLRDPKQAFEALKTLGPLAQSQREKVRQVVLSEGYFYTEHPIVADWLVTKVSLQMLFDEPQIWLLRGSQLSRLELKSGSYRFADGPERGKAATLLLNDRIALTPEALFPALHIDFVPAAEEAAFDRVQIDKITPMGLRAQVRYGAEDLWVPALFHLDGARAHLGCQLIDDSKQAKVQAFRREQRVRLLAAQKLRAAVELEIDEALPFDEPREEEGQQDGSLRPAWQRAYLRGDTGYTFNHIWYPVFDAQNRPHPPQVCVDFILDTYERASGTWFHGKGEPRARVVGKLDFDQAGIANRRSADSVVRHFREHPGTFDVWDLPAEQRIAGGQGARFYDWILDNADALRVPTVIVIHGIRGEEAHYHSFFVYLSDPLTGMPVMVAENAGKPRVRSWHSAMLSGPRRSIKHVLTPQLEWLRTVLLPADSSGAKPDKSITQLQD